MECNARSTQAMPNAGTRAEFVARLERSGVPVEFTPAPNSWTTRALRLTDVDWPTDVVARLLPDLLRALRPGARLVAHEQNRLPAGLTLPPDESRIVVSEQALTVAHVWQR